MSHLVTRVMESEPISLLRFHRYIILSRYKFDIEDLVEDDFVLLIKMFTIKVYYILSRL